ncbi:MAG: hypothetical protein ACI4K9_06720 [Candidatus Fimenecus sp.]
MRKITWILPVLSMCLALLISLGALCSFSPTLVNVLSCDIETAAKTDDTTYTWAQNETAHDLLLWQAKHTVSPGYRAACLQYLINTYYHPEANWSRTHDAEIGETVYQAYLQALEDCVQSEKREDHITRGPNREFYLLNSDGIDKEYTDYGFLPPKTGDVADRAYTYFYSTDLQYAAYVYLHIDKARGKEMYLTYAQNTTDHYFCDEFMRSVLQDKNANAEDLDWAKAQANAAADALSAEYQVFVDLQEECIALYNRLYNTGETPRHNTQYLTLYEQAFKMMPHTNTEYEAKCKTLRNLADA